MTEVISEKPTQPCHVCKCTAWFWPEKYFGKKVWLCGVCISNPNGLAIQKLSEVSPLKSMNG